MVALVSVETVLLVLLVVLVAGLLRSHAEILRRLGPAADGTDRGAGAGRLAEAVAAPPAGPRDERAAPISGITPDGDAVGLDFDGPATAPTLLAFLTSGCSTCAGFWETLGERRLPAVRTVIVTHGADRERPSRLRSLAPPEIPVVMSSPAFEDYAVPGSPYFVLIDGSVRGEGVATTWPALSSLVADAIADEREHEGTSAGTRRVRQVDATLAAAGIGPGHPSLYPSAGVPPTATGGDQR
jgi:hypothetical protein